MMNDAPMSDPHPAAPFDRAVAGLGLRAKLAVGTLGLTMLARMWDIGTRQWSIALVRTYGELDVAAQEAMQGQLDLADKLVDAGAVVVTGMLVVTAICFLRWVHGLVKLTRALGAPDLSWTPAAAVWGFIIPIVSLFRPYQVLRDVQQRLEPEEIAPPQPRVDREAEGGYRNVAFVTPPPARRLSSSMLGLWWGSFVATNLVSRVSNAISKSATGLDAIVSAYHGVMFASALALVAAALAIRVVISLTARLEERFRRIRHSTPESLAQQRVILAGWLR